MARAIVLKNIYPKMMKVSVLDEHAGRQILVPHRHDLAPGTIITYVPRKERRTIFAQGIELFDVPCTQTFKELAFMHHVLELTHYFAPLEQPIFGLYPLLELVYRKPYLFSQQAYKKVFLAHLFIIFGMWPRDKNLQIFFSQNFVLKPLDTQETEHVHLTHEDALDIWLYECIRQHPVHECFKTTDYWK